MRRSCLAAIAVALALAGCGQSASTQTKSQANPSGPVGSTLQVSNSGPAKLEVTVQQVIAPASGANQYSKPASGKAFVGVKLRVKNIGTSSYQNNANNETTIVLSSGKALTADYNPIADCGNFDNGQITLSVGASKTGCVTFQVASGEKVVAVRYGNTVFPGTTAEWHVS